MGMFDSIKCEYRLPNKAHLTEAQTKDFDCQLDNYLIDNGGDLWREEYDTVDKSDPKAKGLLRYRGMMSKENKRWVQMKEFRGEIFFYGLDQKKRYREFSALYDNGKLINIKEQK